MSCSLGYAAPEVVLALEDKRKLAVSAAHDIWALGVHQTIDCHLQDVPAAARFLLLRC